MSGYHSVNYHDLCRLCTASTGTRIHIFSAEGKKKNLYRKISECLPIAVDEKDKLPKIVCGQCLQQVENIVEFRNTCLNTQAMLEGCLNSTLQNGGKVYIKDATPKMATITTNFLKEPVQTTNVTTQGSDFLSTIIQAVGIQSNDDLTTDNRTNMIPHYTVTLDGKSVKTGQVEYKVEDNTSTISAQQADKQSKHNSLAEFLKMKPNIKVTPISKKREITQQAPQPIQAPITITSPETLKVKKPKYNIVITSPTNQQKSSTSIIQATAPSQQQQGPKTVAIQDVKFLSPNKCFLPITIKDCNTDQQIVAHIDTKNLVLPTTYSLQMKLQPQIATVDGQPIVHLTPTAIPATLSLAPTQAITTTQNYQQDQTGTTNQILSSGIDASTSTNEQEIIFTTTNSLHNHQTGGITIQQVPQQVTTTTTSMPKLQITTIPTSIATNSQLQNHKTQQNSGTITVQRMNPHNMKVKVENPPPKLPTQAPKQQHHQQQQQQNTQVKTATITISNANNQKGDGNVSLLECSTCGRGFKKKEHLAQHMKLHAGLRPFKCTEPGCDKAFSRKEHLMRHIVSHTGKKMFSCDLCQKLFSRKDNLNKHKRTHSEQSGGNAQFVCEICHKSFVVKMYYIQHKLMHEKHGQTTANVKTKVEKTDDVTENINATNGQIVTQHNQQQPQIMQLQISSPVVTSSDGTSTISISQAPEHHQHTTTTVLKALGSHDTTVLNLPQSLANLVSINSAQFMTTGELMGHIKLENK